MVHEDKQFAKVERVDTMVLLVVQDNIVIPHIDFVIPKNVYWCDGVQIFIFLHASKVDYYNETRLHTGVLILIHFKTWGQVFSNQRSMMQGTKILCFNLQLILFLNLVINIEGF